MERNIKTNTHKDTKRFTKVGCRGKGWKKKQKKINKEKQQSHNRFKILEEEEEGNNGMNQVLEDSPSEKEKDDSMEDILKNSKLKKDLPSTMELERDHEMIPNEVGMEDHDLQEILERENFDLEKFMEQETTKWLIFYHKRTLREYNNSSFGDLKKRGLESKVTMIARKTEG